MSVGRGFVLVEPLSAIVRDLSLCVCDDHDPRLAPLLRCRDFITPTPLKPEAECVMWGCNQGEVAVGHRCTIVFCITQERNGGDF
jgi:hypothetical protein